MIWLKRFVSRLHTLLHKHRLEEELDEELRLHVQMQTEENVAAGMNPREAQDAARCMFGGVSQIKDEYRDRWAFSRLETLAQDLRYGVRMLGRSPGFAAAVVLSLALGIGANTAIFSLLDAVMWRMLPVKDPERLLVVARQAGSEIRSGFTYDEYKLIRENQDLADIAGYALATFNVRIDGNHEPTVEGQLVSGGYFALLGVNPILGRAIGVEDDRVPNGHAVAMLSYGYWERRFGRDAAVIGRTMRLLDTTFTIIGVTPPEFFGVEVGAAPDIFVPLMMQPAVMPAFENLLENPIVMRMWVKAVARVRPDGVREQASAALNTVFGRFQDERFQRMPPKFRGMNPEREMLTLLPATGLSELRQQFSKPLFVLMGVVGLVLLIACANTANLLLARAVARRPEFSIRLALGAGRGRLIRQLLLESAVLAVLGGVCGILLARWATQLLVAYISSGRTAIVLDLNPNPRILMFTAAISLLTAILFGLAPAVRASRIRLNESLRSLRASVSGGQRRLGPQKTLAAVQVSLSLLLLVGAGLFVRSLQELSGDDYGISRDQVLIARVEPRGSDQRNIPGTSARLDRIYRELIERVGAIPEVRTLSMAQVTPTVPFGGAGVAVTTSSGEQLRIQAVMAYPKYFSTVGIPLVAGRDFTVDDLQETSAAVCIVNEAFVQKVFPAENPIGKPCTLQYRPNLNDVDGPRYRSAQEPYTIVGIVQDSRYMNPQDRTEPVVYMPFTQTPTGRGQMVLYVRGASDVRALLPRIREEITRVDPSLPVSDVHTLDEEMAAALVQQRLIAMLTSLFGLLALLLACVGIYGLLAFSVTQRTSEIGIRTALGAQRASVMWMVMREALALVGIGIAIGVPVALSVTRLVVSQLPGLLFGLEAGDPLTLSGATMFLVVVATLAAYVPARRASRVDPIMALRNE
jgi:predicted permease